MAASPHSTRSMLRSAVEPLETRRLMCAVHAAAAKGAPVGSYPSTPDQIAKALAEHATKGPVKDHDASYYRPSGRVKVRPALGRSQTTADPAAASTPAAAVSVTTNAAGLPLLASRPNTGALNVFLDFDGYNTDIPFDLSVADGGDNNGATFNAKEQSVIYNVWRDIVSYYAMFNVSVTTIQPATGGTNPAFVWQRITDSVSGGAAYVGAINNYASMGWTDDSNALYRTSGIAHEIGHQLSLSHQSDYTEAAVKNEYSSGFKRHGPIMGVDFAQNVHQFTFGRNSDNVATFQDDLAWTANYIKRFISGPGLRPDDYAGTTLTSASQLSLVNGTYQTTGVIEQATDADYFAFASTGQAFGINVAPLFESALAAKVEVYSASGTLMAARDDTALRDGSDNAGVDLNLTLPAGQYVVKVTSHGDYGDVGEYAFSAASLPANWSSVDVGAGAGGRGGSVAYDPATGTFAQVGGGADIWTNTDSFRYTYVPLTGNGSVTARVVGLDNVDFHAKAGIMLRETLAANSKFAMMAFKPTTSQLLWRSDTGATAAETGTGLLMPSYVRLTRNGNLVTVTSSADGTSFTNTVGTITLTSLANQVYVGLATNARTTKQVANSTFTNVAVTGNTATPTVLPNTLAAPTNVTAAAVSGKSTATVVRWSDGAGETGYAIERSVDGLTWSQIGTTAANATSYTDSSGLFGAMRWWYRVAALDGGGKSRYGTASVVNKPAAPTNPLIVNVSGSSTRSLSWRDVSGDTGYRVERSTDGGSTFAAVATTAANATGYNDGSATPTSVYRVTPLSAAGDGVPLVLNPGTGVAAVTGLAIDNVTASSVRLFWNDNAGETGYRVDRSLTRKNPVWTALTTLGANVTGYTDAAASALTHYFYRVVALNGSAASTGDDVAFAATPSAATVPTPWADVDLGNPNGPGAGTLTGTNTATVIGGGGSALDAADDQYNFLYRTLTGDGEIVARVASLENAASGTRAGVVFRESLASNARSVGTYYGATIGFQGTDMAYRAATGGPGVKVDGPDASAARYLRVVRQGSTFTSYASDTGPTGPWTQIGQATLADAPATMYVGLAAAAGDNTTMAAATFDNVSVGPTAVAIPTTLVVNGGQAQRARVTSLAVTFAQGVSVAPGGITLWQKASPAAVATQVLGFTLTPSPGGATHTLTFPSPAFANGSLADGVYEVRVAAGLVTTIATGATMAADSVLTAYRLAGDADGNRAVDFADFVALQSAFGQKAADPSFNAAVDLDDNGVIDFADFVALQSAFGRTI